MLLWKRWIRAALLAGAVAALHGCSSGCDQETVDRAMAFMQAHQACETAADCVVSSDYCEELAGGYCGQLTMNKVGAESAEWAEIDAELESCAPSSCTVCTAALVPTCTNGSCGGP